MSILFQDANVDGVATIVDTSDPVDLINYTFPADFFTEAGQAALIQLSGQILVDANHPTIAIPLWINEDGPSVVIGNIAEPMGFAMEAKFTCIKPNSEESLGTGRLELKFVGTNGMTKYDAATIEPNFMLPIHLKLFGEWNFANKSLSNAFTVFSYQVYTL